MSQIQWHPFSEVWLQGFSTGQALPCNHQGPTHFFLRYLQLIIFCHPQTLPCLKLTKLWEALPEYPVLLALLWEVAQTHRKKIMCVQSPQRHRKVSLWKPSRACDCFSQGSIWDHSALVWQLQILSLLRILPMAQVNATHRSSCSTFIGGCNFRGILCEFIF